MYALAAAIHRTIEPMWPSPDIYGGLIHSPGLTEWPRKPCPPTFVFRDVPQNPTHDRRVGNHDSPLCHHRGEVAVAQPVCQVQSFRRWTLAWCCAASCALIGTRSVLCAAKAGPARPSTTVRAAAAQRIR